jgi:hypothetical protein
MPAVKTNLTCLHCRFGRQVLAFVRDMMHDFGQEILRIAIIK